MKLQVLSILSIFSVFLFFADAYAESIPVANYSFEAPVIPPETTAITAVSDWEELDINGGFDTGAFPNYPGYPHTIVNSDANQVAYLIGIQGNAFQQELPDIYQVEKSYRLTVGVCVSYYVAPPEVPGDPLKLSFYYVDGTEPNDIVTTLIPRAGRGNTLLDDFSVFLPMVKANDPWAGKNIGIAIRGTGAAGGAWDIDNVRVTEYPLVPNFTDDSIVNFADFAKMAADWLYCDEPLTDVTGEGCVDEQDLIIMTEYWLENV